MVSDEYIAGFFDGEGSVSIDVNARCSVSISQNKKEVLQLIQFRYGGNIHSKNRKTNTCSALRITKSSDVLKFLKRVLPYSIVKKEEIEIGIKVAETVHDFHSGCVPLTSEERSVRESLRAEMQNLRPKKNFVNLQSLEYRYRQDVKEQAGYKCNACQKDLTSVRIRDQIISQDKLWCRNCFVRTYNTKEYIPLTREQIQEAFDSSNNLEEACKKLKIGRASLYQKRKKLGMPLVLGVNRHNGIKQFSKVSGE